MEDESVYYALSKGAKKYAENFKMSIILPKYVKFYYKRAIQGSFANCNISVDLDLFNEGITEYI